MRYVDQLLLRLIRNWVQARPTLRPPGTITRPRHQTPRPYSGVFSHFVDSAAMQQAVWYLLALALLGTALANILFNKLIKLSSPVFAASVTYLIPLVAVLWGFLDGERISMVQLLGGLIILFGVWLVNRKKQ